MKTEIETVEQFIAALSKYPKGTAVRMKADDGSEISSFGIKRMYEEGRPDEYFIVLSRIPVNVPPFNS